jgi:glycosyltransferase involved in cell wall biosynthesis
LTGPGSRSILLVAHFYPPAREVAANRPEAMARYLRRLGHRVAVLTTSAFGELPDDAENGIVRSYDLQLLQARLAGEERAAATMDSGAYKRAPHLISRLAVPDAQLVAWTGFARRRALGMLRRERPDCVITTSPPESVHLIGAALRRRGVPWVADLRDSWVFESMKDRIWLWRWQHRLSERMEGRLLHRADVLTTVTPPMAEDLRERVGVAPVHLIPNGWDPEVPREVDAAAEAMLDPERASIVFTGQLGGARRDPTPLIEALASLARSDPETARKLELVFAGSFSEDELRLFETDVSPARIEMVGALPRPQALALQRAADAALIVTGPRKQEASAKLYEYIGSQVPVLAIAHPDTAAAETVRETGAGIAVSPDDREGIEAALRRVTEGDVPRISEEDRLAFSWPNLAGQMAAAVEEAIASRARE